MGEVIAVQPWPDTRQLVMIGDRRTGFEELDELVEHAEVALDVRVAHDVERNVRPAAAQQRREPDPERVAGPELAHRGRCGVEPCVVSAYEVAKPHAVAVTAGNGAPGVRASASERFDRRHQRRDPLRHVPELGHEWLVLRSKARNVARSVSGDGRGGFRTCDLSRVKRHGAARAHRVNLAVGRAVTGLSGRALTPRDTARSAGMSGDSGTFRRRPRSDGLSAARLRSAAERESGRGPLRSRAHLPLTSAQHFSDDQQADQKQRNDEREGECNH